MFQLKPISVTLPTATPRSVTTEPTVSPSTSPVVYVSNMYVGLEGAADPEDEEPREHDRHPQDDEEPDPELAGLFAHEVWLPCFPAPAASAWRRKNCRTYGLSE